MNPMAMIKMKQALSTFSNNHPKVVQFMKSVLARGVEEGTIIELSIQRPGEEKIITNLKVQKSDIELFESLKNMNR